MSNEPELEKLRIFHRLRALNHRMLLCFLFTCQIYIQLWELSFNKSQIQNKQIRFFFNFEQSLRKIREKKNISSSKCDQSQYSIKSTYG
jgi:hypothetical protein